MNSTKRRSRLAFLARAMRDEATRMTGDRRAAMTHDAVQLSYIYRTLERQDVATVDAFMEAAIDTIVAAASSRVPWLVSS